MNSSVTNKIEIFCTSPQAEALLFAHYVFDILKQRSVIKSDPSGDKTIAIDEKTTVIFRRLDNIK